MNFCPQTYPQSMKIIAIADLHGHLPALESADVVCIVGDITPDCYRLDADRQWLWFNDVYMPWVAGLDCRKVITVAGNHDYCFEKHKPGGTDKHIYLENNGKEIDGVSFYGTPNVVRPVTNLAFYRESEELSAIFRQIPDNLDVLLCHSSPYGVNGCGRPRDSREDLGSRELTGAIRDKEIAHIFCGHIHTGNHKTGIWRGKSITNAALCNDKKELAYPPATLAVHL